MKVLFSKLLHYRRRVYAIYALLTFLMLLATITGKTSFDLMEFLPKDALSVKGTQLLVQAGKSVASLWLMVPSEPIDQVQMIKYRLEQLPGIHQIIWLDDWENPYNPNFAMDSSITNTYLAGNKTLLEIQLSPSANRDEQDQLIQMIQRQIPKDAVLGGEPLVMVELKKVMQYQPRLFLIIAIFAIFLVLSLFLKSWKKPLVVLTCMGVSIIVTLGLASLFQSMSMITRVLTPAILMGITLDYALFFIHRLEESYGKPITFNEVIILALLRTLKPVTISAITTIIGLFALTLMNFQMGPDLGLALLRGVSIS